MNFPALNPKKSIVASIYMSEIILKTENLKTHFPISRNIFSPRRNKETVKAVDDVSFSIKKGSSLGLVGESGCGKSTLARTIIRLLKPSSGKIVFNGEDITHLPEKHLRKLRRNFQIVFQNPYASLNPRMTVFNAIAEPLREYKIVPGKKILDEVSSLMSTVGLSADLMRKYPHEFSGGQRQRIAIARALAVNPKLLIADEPVSALDVSIQAQILNLISELRHKKALTLLFISHNLAVIKHITDRVAVMYLGKIVETGNTEQIFSAPSHPYTKSLLAAIPIPDPEVERNRPTPTIIGAPPSPINPPSGCIFHPRCAQAQEKCTTIMPELRPLSKNQDHLSACHFK